MKTVLIFAGLALSSFNLHAQATPPAAPSAHPAPLAKHFKACTDDVDPESGLTDCEALLLREYLAESTPHQQAVQEIEAKFRKAALAIQAEHPGMIYQGPQPGFPTGRLVPEPKPADPPKPDTSAAPAPAVQK